MTRWAKGIMGYLEGRTHGLTMVKMDELDIDQVIKNAVTQYAREGISWLREDLATPVDALRPPEAPSF
jgi:hypothetical protein